MMDEPQGEAAKRAAILEAAFAVFAAYGYRRVSMEDIARGAGMSRPALYLHFRNKEAIFRALTEHFFTRAAGAVETALAQGGTPVEALTRAFLAQAQDVEALLNSPHGNELVDTSGTLSADLAEEGEARLAALYEAWIRREAAAGRLRLAAPPELLAETIQAALHGIKTPPFERYRQRLKALAQLFGRGLSV